ncbi:hypothetical protein ACN42_g199 [Penicillium freii]|uniref:Uncharacterized protein n=1 Tax=Penicillium freii TaxID=48697 RepID=A0A124GTL9_PENFR|nr:hypothetical protein ACN42_g199 [Penicillium freii]
MSSPAPQSHEEDNNPPQTLPESPRTSRRRHRGAIHPRDSLPEVEEAHRATPPHLPTRRRSLPGAFRLRIRSTTRPRCLGLDW